MRAIAPINKHTSGKYRYDAIRNNFGIAEPFVLFSEPPCLQEKAEVSDLLHLYSDPTQVS